MNDIVLSATGLVMRFGGITATDNVTLNLKRGARHALIGPNGAGKTTLINLLTGVLTPTAGRIVLEGEDITRLAPHRRVARGMVRTFQINQLFDSMTPLETLALVISQQAGLAAQWWRPLGSSSRVSERAAQLLEQFHLGDVAQQQTRQLAYGKRRLLEIAIALACEPRVLLLDEPVAGVPAGEREELLQTVAALPADVSVLLIEHDMDLVFSFADRMTVLVNGALLTEGDPDTIANDPKVKEVYLGQGLSMSELLRIEKLSAGYGEAVVLHDIALTLGEGQTLALLGRNGTGKTTLINTLAGATRQHGGSIALGGVALHKLSPHQRAAAGIGWVPQERNIFKSLTVHENLSAVERPGKWNPQRVYEMFPRLAERKSNLGTQLSGGEQQMLAVGRALVVNPRLLLLDEPLEGLAPIIVEELLRAIRRITQDEGLAAIIVEQHPQAILAISDEAVVLDHGTVVHADRAATLRTQPEVLERLLGVAR